MLETKRYVPCLVIDFSKAFDVVNHEILLYKLSALDLPNKKFNWIVSFLTRRQQKCIINGVCSQLDNITRGIIQGSGLGPTLYIISKNDI